MILSARYPITNLYRVEVSGWDKNQTFFVEKSELEWSEESGKQVTLSMPFGLGLRSGLASGAAFSGLPQVCQLLLTLAFRNFGFLFNSGTVSRVEAAAPPSIFRKL